MNTSQKIALGTALGVSGLLLAVACSTGLGHGTLNAAPPPIPNANVGQGFEPGVAPTSPIASDVALCGGVIPGAGGNPDRRILFFAFTTAAAADNADGSGAPLVRDNPAPSDTNGASDVFLAAVIQSSAPGSATPVAFSQALVNTFRRPSCEICHSFHYPGGHGSGNQHTGGDSDGTNNGCNNCHGAVENVAVWKAPLPTLGDFEFKGKTLQQLVDQTQSVGGITHDPTLIRDHLKNDERINWAIDNGNLPGGNFEPPAPISKAQWDAQVDAWIDNGMQVSTAGAVKDIALVSQLHFGGPSSGDGASLSPSATFVPTFNALDPDLIGYVYVAFASDATDLIAGSPSTARDVYRARLQVRIDEDPASTPTVPIADPGSINLFVEQDQLQRISTSAASGDGGDLDSDNPAISADGNWVAFESDATDLVTGFAATNALGQRDIFVGDASAAFGPVYLVSRQFGSTTTGSNGDSRNPSISSFGDAIAFDSSSDDLLGAPGDTNAARDVFYARFNRGTSTVTSIARASVDSTGLEGSGGDCRKPSVYFDGAETFVAFESDKTNLAHVGGVLPATSVWMHRSSGATVLVSGRKSGQSMKAGNGNSLAPIISADGATILFETLASNLDTVRVHDKNNVGDVARFDLAAFLTSGAVAIERLSVAADGSDADGASTAPLLGAFVKTAGVFDQGTFGAYTTAATNLGAAENSNHVLVFIQ